MWSKVSNTDGFPKINMSTGHWLTIRSLQGKFVEKGVQRSLQVRSLYHQAKETSVHLFLDCLFSKEVWKHVLQNLFSHIRWPNIPNKLFNKWKASYKGSLDQKQAFKEIFLALPKFTTWKIWLARNRALFSEEFSTLVVVATKSLGLLVEHFNMRKQKLVSPTMTK
jgi:hypothetical protein